MSRWCNFHTHSNFCDGKSTLEAILDSAHQKKLISIGLSSHAPLPFERGWCMKPDHLEHYIQHVNELKKTTREVEVYCGLEVDYIPGKISPSVFSTRLDYTIGSIHFVDSFPDHNGWEIDGPHVHFAEGLEKIFRNDIRAAVVRYHELTREMLLVSPPSILGHFDKIKIQNAYQSYFDESEPWYREQMTQTVHAIRESGCIVEVNTRGLYQKKTMTAYPSPWILEQLCRENIRITLSSDAHQADDLCNQFEETARLLRGIGFKKICILRGGRWQEVAFDEHGITLT